MIYKHRLIIIMRDRLLMIKIYIDKDNESYTANNINNGF